MHSFSLKNISSTVLLVFITACIKAQDTTKTVTTTSTTSSEPLWYMQPWVWVVGAIILLFLLIAIFSGGSKKEKNTSRTDKVIITKTVRTETDVE